MEQRRELEAGAPKERGSREGRTGASAGSMCDGNLGAGSLVRHLAHRECSLRREHDDNDVDSHTGSLTLGGLHLLFVHPSLKGEHSARGARF